MQKLHAKYIKVIAANGDLNAATELKLAKDAVVIKAEGIMHEHITSENPNPEERIEIGTLLEIRGVFGAADQQKFVDILGGSETTNVYTKIQGIRTLPLWDIRIAVFRSTDALLVLKDLTDMNFMPEIEESYEQGGRFYLPFTAKSTAGSTYTSDNSAV